MTKSATTTIPASDPTPGDATITPPSTKLVAPITQDPADDANGEPASEDAIASEASEPAAPATIEVPSTTSDGEGSSDSETGDAEDDDDSVGREGVEDEMDALTRGFEQQASISHSTYLQTVEGEVIAAGPGFTVRPGYYVSKRGIVHDTTRPPPRPCFNCNGDHWRKDCPRGVRY